MLTLLKKISIPPEPIFRNMWPSVDQACSVSLWMHPSDVNTLRLGQNGCHFTDDIFQCIFLNKNVWVLLKNSLKFVPEVRIKNIPALVQIMTWRRPGDKLLSEPMMVGFLTHVCIARPQWVKSNLSGNMWKHHKCDGRMNGRTQRWIDMAMIHPLCRKTINSLICWLELHVCIMIFFKFYLINDM